MKQKSEDKNLLKDVVLHALFDKKAKDVVCLDLRKIEEAVADYFIVCHGESTTQVNALADNVSFEVKKQLNENALSTEGARAAEWVLVDYGDVVVHVFHRDKREFYQLEDLWSDAVLTEFDDSPNLTTTKESKKKNERKTKKK